MTPRRAFTLIELLVVIAIIVVLIGIMVPVLGQSKAMARAVQCGSNIHQLAMANSSYANDYRRYVPGAANEIANLDRWHGRRSSLSAPFDPAKGPLWTYLGSTPAIKKCPDFTSFQTGYEAGCGGYGYNNAYLGKPAPDDFGSALGAPSDSVQRLSDTVMFTDAAFSQPSGSGPSSAAPLIEYSFAEPPQHSSGPADPSIHFRHRRLASVAWADTHVQRMPLAFTRANVYGVSEQENTRLGVGWFGPADNTLFDRE